MFCWGFGFLFCFGFVVLWFWGFRYFVKMFWFWFWLVLFFCNSGTPTFVLYSVFMGVTEDPTQKKNTFFKGAYFLT